MKPGILENEFQLVQGSACQDPMGNCPGNQGVLVQAIDLQEQPLQNTEVNHSKSPKVKEMWYKSCMDG